MSPPPHHRTPPPPPLPPPGPPPGPPGPGWGGPRKSRPGGGHDYNDASRGPRLHKVLADAGVGSRRACEELIETGAVTVNAQIVRTLPAWVDPIKDRITVNGRTIKRPEAPIYIILFKPRGVVCTNDDPEGRVRVVDLVDHPSRSRLYPVGRLDIESSGLILLTNDGEIANRVTHPRYGVHKVYEVTIDGALDEPAVRKLESGVFLSDQHATHGRKHGKKTGRSRLQLVRTGRDRTQLRMELREGRNRQIRRMMLHVGHKVRKLRRIEMGPLKLAGLRPGQWRELFPTELDALKRACGLGKPRRPDGPAKTRRPDGPAKT